MRSDGTTTFAGMQAATDEGADSNLVYFAFDLLYYHDGMDLRSLPLRERKDALKKLLKRAPPQTQYSDHYEGSGAELLAQACQTASEGIVSKDARAPYLSGDRGKWLKIKCHQRAEIVIVGYYPAKGPRHHFGSLLLGYYDKRGRLEYAGRVGTGIFSEAVGPNPREASAAPGGKDAVGRGPNPHHAVWLST